MRRKLKSLRSAPQVLFEAGRLLNSLWMTPNGKYTSDIPRFCGSLFKRTPIIKIQRRLYDRGQLPLMRSQKARWQTEDTRSAELRLELVIPVLLNVPSRMSHCFDSKQFRIVVGYCGFTKTQDEPHAVVSITHGARQTSHYPVTRIRYAAHHATRTTDRSSESGSRDVWFGIMSCLGSFDKKDHLKLSFGEMLMVCRETVNEKI